MLYSKSCDGQEAVKKLIEYNSIDWHSNYASIKCILPALLILNWQLFE